MVQFKVITCFLFVIGCNVCMSNVNVFAKENNNDFLQYAKSCSPNVDSKIIQALTQIESNFSPFAINVNGGYVLEQQPKNLEDAYKAIIWLQKHNYNYDVGLLQINSNNFMGLNKTAFELLEPCNNLKASSIILTNCYKKALKQSYVDDIAILHALSCYNTGDLHKGITNGYVDKFKRAYVKFDKNSIVIPAISQKSLNQGNITQKNKSKTDVFNSDNGDIFNVK